jgi:hypothetical protein
MPWLIVKLTLDREFNALPIPDLALDVHLAGMPGAPGAIALLFGHVSIIYKSGICVFLELAARTGFVSNYTLFVVFKRKVTNI